MMFSNINKHDVAIPELHNNLNHYPKQRERGGNFTSYKCVRNFAFFPGVKVLWHNKRSLRSTMETFRFASCHLKQWFVNRKHFVHFAAEVVGTLMCYSASSPNSQPFAARLKKLRKNSFITFSFHVKS